MIGRIFILKNVTKSIIYLIVIIIFNFQLVTQCIQLWGCILAICIVISIGLLRYFRVITSNDSSSNIIQWIQFFVELPICAVLPMLPLAFPFMWIAINLWGIARLQTLMAIPQPNRIVDDQKSFQEDLDTPTYDWENVPLPVRNVFWHWLELWRGDSQLLGRSANVVQVLGSITALCCVDKKGILSWPNPTAEKVFFIRDAAEKKKSSASVSANGGGVGGASIASESSLESELSSDNDDVDKASVGCGGNEVSKVACGAASGAVAEVLDLTHDQHSAFRLEFDDHEWKDHISSLKPLGKKMRVFDFFCLLKMYLFLRFGHFGEHMLSIDASSLRKILWSCDGSGYARQRFGTCYQSVCHC